MLHASPPFRCPIESSVVKEKEESMLSSNTQQKGGRAGEKEKNWERKKEGKPSFVVRLSPKPVRGLRPDRHYDNRNTTNPLWSSGHVASTVYVCMTVWGRGGEREKLNKNKKNKWKEDACACVYTFGSGGWGWWGTNDRFLYGAARSIGIHWFRGSHSSALMRLGISLGIWRLRLPSLPVVAGNTATQGQTKDNTLVNADGSRYVVFTFTLYVMHTITSTSTSTN